MQREVVRVQKKLDLFHEALDRSRATLNRYKCVGGASGAAAKPGMGAFSGAGSTTNGPAMELTVYIAAAFTSRKLSSPNSVVSNSREDLAKRSNRTPVPTSDHLRE